MSPGPVMGRELWKCLKCSSIIMHIWLIQNDNVASEICSSCQFVLSKSRGQFLIIILCHDRSTNFLSRNQILLIRKANGNLREISRRSLHKLYHLFACYVLTKIFRWRSCTRTLKKNNPTQYFKNDKIVVDNKIH